MKRRALLIGGAAGGGLLVGWSLLPPRSRLGHKSLLPAAEGEVALNGWIKIAPDGGVQLAMARSEMGQGVHTALPMLVAEELDISLDRVTLIAPGRDAIYGNVATLVASLPLHPRDKAREPKPFSVWAGEWMVAKLARELGLVLTGGSTSMADAWEPLRLAAATARAQLVGAASLRWRLPKEEITVGRGIVAHHAGYQAHFGELAAAAAATPAGEVSLKSRAAWMLIGKRVPRTDVPAKSDGRAVFGLDVRPPGLLYAAVRMCPTLGGWPGRIPNEEAVLRRPGVLRLVRLRPVAGATAGVAVVGVSTWHAQQAVQALEIEWRPPPAGVPDSRSIEANLARRARDALAADEGFAFHTRGDPIEAEREAPGARVVEALYRAPFLAHMALEPINATAQLRDGKLTLWLSTQVPSIACSHAAREAGIDEDAVTVHVTLLGGGFGRRLDADVVPQAVAVAAECGGRPVQVVWSREEDTTHDFYRPAAAAALRALLGADGLPRVLRATGAADAIVPRWLERNLPWLAGPVDAPDKTTAEGLYDQPYAIPHQRITHVATRSGVPIGYWRSVGHSHNAFFIESFIDELAHVARQDPLAYRLALLGDSPRHATVLRLAADKAGWDQPLGDGRARGLALHESFGSVAALVVEIVRDETRPGGVRVARMVCAFDCGTVVNPGIVAQQIEGALLFGLTGALHGRIDIEAGVVQQRNFDTQPLVTLAGTPVIEAHLVTSTAPPAGAGEPGTPPVAPALANALFALSGRRQRELPLQLEA